MPKKVLTYSCPFWRMTITTPQLKEFFLSTDPKMPDYNTFDTVHNRFHNYKTKQWALRHSPLTDANEWCTCWHEFEDSSSTIAQPGNLELAAQVGQLDQEVRVAGILGHDLQHKQQHVTNSAVHFLYASSSLLQFRTVVSMCSEKPVCTHKFPQHCLWNSANVPLIENGPISSFQGRSSNASSFHTSLLHITAVMSLALRQQVVSQAPQHFKSSETQAWSFPFTLACPNQYIHRSFRKWMSTSDMFQSGFPIPLFTLNSVNLWGWWHMWPGCHLLRQSILEKQSHTINPSSLLKDNHTLTPSSLLKDNHTNPLFALKRQLHTNPLFALERQSQRNPLFALADLFTPLFTCQYFGQKLSVIQGVSVIHALHFWLL